MELEDRMVVATPEGIDLELVVAGLGSRAIGLLVDLLVQAALAGLVGLAASLGDLGTAFVAIGLFLVGVGYPVLFETFADGRSPGKWAAGLRVVTTEGRPVTFLTSVVRNAVRIVDAIPGVYTVGMIAIAVSAKHQRLGDLAAGTVVVRVPKRSEAVAPASTGPVALPPDAASWDVSAVTQDELATVRSFLDRRASLTPQARHQVALELATRLHPKVRGVPVEHGPEAFLDFLAAAKVSR